MVTMTENGSGGSRIGAITSFEDPGGDYDRQLGEMRSKILGIGIGETVIKRLAVRPSEYWLGAKALINPSLDLHRPSEAAVFIAPVLEPPEANSRYN